MKRCVSIFLFLALFQSAALLPYAAQKKGIIVEATDYARTPEALCIEAPVSESVQGEIGKGIPARIFLERGYRPVGITVTNNTDKPIMLSPSYGPRVNGQLIDFMAGGASSQNVGGWLAGMSISGVAIYISFFATAITHRHDRHIPLMFLMASVASFVVTTVMAINGGVILGQFQRAMKEKFEELNFKDETVILPGKTVNKLLLCTKDDYISRFPLVIYPLENREDMLVFDVDLRA